MSSRAGLGMEYWICMEAPAELPTGDAGAEFRRPPPLLAFFLAAAIVASRYSGTKAHFMPLPGSSGRRGTL